MKIKMMPADKLIALKDNIDSMKTKYESNSNSWIIEELGKDAFIDTKFEDKNVILKISDDEKNDYDNVVAFYGAYKEVFSDSVAAEERLWVGFTLGKYWEYSTIRWRKNKDLSIKSRLFFGKDHPLMRNAISRLWWIGRLTYDNSNPKDPWKYTRYVCNNQRFIVDFLERNLSNSFSIIKPCIDAVLEYESKHGETGILTSKMREIQKYINILGGIYILDCLDYEFLKNKIYNKITEIM